MQSNEVNVTKESPFFPSFRPDNMGKISSIPSLMGVGEGQGVNLQFLKITRAITSPYN